MLVKEIPASETYNLRHNVLRAGFARHTVHYEQDRLDGAFHLGVYAEENLICVGSFYKITKIDPHILSLIIEHSKLTVETKVENGKEYSSENIVSQTPLIYQLRGMATLAEFRNHGAGSLLLTSAKNILKAKGVKLIWCNAREKAFPFYHKMGFMEVGEFFNSYTIPHKIMYKRLN